MISNPKILIIQTAYLGDVILTLPVVQNIKKQLPGSGIDFLCIPQTVAVLRNNPYLRKIVVYDKRGKNKFAKLRNITSTVKKFKYDVVISPHRSFRSALITHLSGADLRIGFNKNAMSSFLTQRVAYVKNTHEILRNLELIKVIPGINFTSEQEVLKPELFPSDEDFSFVEQIISSMLPAFTGKGLISFAPCSKWFTKQLPGKKAVELIKRLIDSGLVVVLIGGKEDSNYCKKIEKVVNEPGLLNLCGKLTSLQSKVVIEKSACLISVDSAAAHIGASTDIPIVQVYGSTLPAFGFYPLTSKNVIIENDTLACRPCTDHGRKSCPLKHFKCMEDLDLNKIIESAGRLTKEN
jgi:heptosyltransferase-2